MDELSRKGKSSGIVKAFTKSEKLKDYAGAIAILLGALPAVGSLIVSLVTAYKGEPVAEKTWNTVRIQLNQQAEMINNLRLSVIQVQAHEEGKTLASLQIKLDDLQKRYDQLLSSNKNSDSKIESFSKIVECKEGFINIKGKCQVISRIVESKFKEEQQKTELMKKRLEEEMSRRVLEESRRRIVEKKIQAVKDEEPLLRPLPKELDDVARRK